jgi:hypothetical protein
MGRQLLLDEPADHFQLLQENIKALAALGMGDGTLELALNDDSSC